MPPIRITSVDDPRIAPYQSLTDAELLRDHGLFIAEGRLVVQTLLTATSLTTRSVLLTEPAFDSLADVLQHRGEVPVFVVSQAVMNDIAGFNIHRGCLALGERPPARAVESLIGSDPSRLVVLEQVSNADNTGGIFRSAAAFGTDGIVLGPGCGDPLYRKAIRTSIGAALRVPFARAADWPGALGTLQAHGYAVAALTPRSDAASLDDIAGELRAMERLAILAGAEGTGLSDAALAAADRRIRIPMAHGVDSLNVVVAVGIALSRVSLV